MSEAKDLALEEIVQTYRGEWVVIEVTRRDENGQPTRGRVLGHDVDRFRLREQFFELQDFCIFYAGEPDYPVML